MIFSRIRQSGQGLLAALAFPAFAVAQFPGSPEPRPHATAETPQFRTKTATSLAAARMVPLDALNPNLRERVKKVITQPTLVTHAPVEEFQASPKMYRWLMDHPDRAVQAWQRLGVACSPITDRGQGRFGWTDDQGSDVVWSTIADGPQARIWYAEGQVHPGPLMPTIPVRAVVVMRHRLPDGEQGKIQHEIDIFCHADSRAAHLAYRLFGPATDRMAEQASEQLLLFFSVMSRYMAQHPEQAERLLAPVPVRAASK
jgi:hypothetical protein